MTLSEELEWRGFIHQTTLDDIKALDVKKVTFYHGFDASADSQTVGNLAGMMFDKTLMRHGHKAILLAGGATSLIGDPGGKDAERPMQSEETIAHNVAQAEVQLKRIHEGTEFILVNNIDWIKNMSVIQYLRDVGKHFSMTQLLDRDYIARRIKDGGTGISYTEFSYSLLQGLDFMHLYDEYECTLQVGSSDQWGNCVAGIDLIRRARGAEVHVLTHPLVINKATGKKFGRSEEGAVWLDESKTSVYKFYQFWLNVDDQGVIEYLKVYTVLNKDQIDKLTENAKQDPGAREAQKVLAYEVTKLVHGQDRAESVKRVTDVLFGERSVTDLNDEDIESLAAEIPTVKVGVSVVDALVSTGIATSNGEARRLIESGGITVNGQKIDSDKEPQAVSIVKKGKNAFILVK